MEDQSTDDDVIVSYYVRDGYYSREDRRWSLSDINYQANLYLDTLEYGMIELDVDVTLSGDNLVTHFLNIDKEELKEAINNCLSEKDLIFDPVLAITLCSDRYYDYRVGTLTYGLNELGIETDLIDRKDLGISINENTYIVMGLDDVDFNNTSVYVHLCGENYDDTWCYASPNRDLGCVTFNLSDDVEGFYLVTVKSGQHPYWNDPISQSNDIVIEEGTHVYTAQW